MSKCQVEWVEGEDGYYRWKCKRFFLSAGTSFPAERETCYHFRCAGRRGLHFNGVEVTDYKIKEVKKEEVPVVEVASVPICAWYKCDNPVALNKLRHCSEVCRKRQNRYDYKQRQKLKRQT